jgi:hypothetical protein
MGNLFSGETKVKVRKPCLGEFYTESKSSAFAADYLREIESLNDKMTQSALNEVRQRLHRRCVTHVKIIN